MNTYARRAKIAAMGSATTDVEVEWQFDALDLRPVERWLATFPNVTDRGVVGEAREIAPFAARADARPAERLVDTYLDTSDWRIGRAGFVLRLRNRGGRGGEVTLKAIAPSAGGLRTRLEVSEAIPPGGVDALGAQGPVGWRLHALIGKRPLQPVLEVHTRRRPFDLLVEDQQVAEVALDETTILVGDDHQPVRLQRVEVEVDPSRVEPLTPMVDALRRQCGLQPAALSKFEAGLLAAGRGIPAPPDLGPTTVRPDSSVGELAFATLRRHLAAMLANEPGTRLGEDAEALHDMRVATRRLRAALSLFADALPVRARTVRVELGWLADALGEVRDLDVQLDRLDGWAREVPAEDRAALSELTALLRRARTEARAHLLACLDSARYERLVANFMAMLRQGPSRRSVAARAPAVAVGADLVRARHRSATKAAKRARRTGDPADFHRTRIRAKRLRYALEFLQEVYGGETARYTRHVVKLQDALGLIQDARVAAARLRTIATTESASLTPVTIFVMGGIAARCGADAERLAKKVPDLLHELRGPEWKKVQSLMEHRRLQVGSLYRWPVTVPHPAARRSPPAPAPVAPSAHPIEDGPPDAGSGGSTSGDALVDDPGPVEPAGGAHQPASPTPPAQPRPPAPARRSVPVWLNDLPTTAAPGPETTRPSAPSEPRHHNGRDHPEDRRT
jgi:triphosphatase